MAEAKTCFVIAPIGDPESDIRKRSDQILKHIITPAANACEYEALRADQISEPGIITTQVIQHIVDDPLVIADLTGRNPNVFYELAIRHAIKKPLVQVIKKGEPIPFDVAGTRTVHVDHHDLDSVEEAKKEIIKQIRCAENDAAQVDTPISVALDLQVMRQSDSPEQRSLADVVAAMSELRSGLQSIEERLSDPQRLIPADYLEYLARKGPRTARQRDNLSELRVLARRLVESTESEEKTDLYEKQVVRLARFIEELVSRIIYEAF